MAFAGPTGGSSIGGASLGGGMVPGYQRTASGTAPKPFAPPEFSSAAIVAQMAETQDAAVEARRSLAYLATLCLLCIYAAPTVISLHLAVDTDSAYWIGRFGYFALLAPITIVAVHLMHIAHLTAGGRSKMHFVLAAVVPILIFFLVGSSYMVGASKLDLPAFEACASGDAPARVLELETAYVKGRQALDVCSARTDARLQAPTLDMCQEWTGESPRIVKKGNHYTVYNRGRLMRLFRNVTPLRRKYGHELAYLSTTEANHACSSFCRSGPMIWHKAGSVIGFRGEPCAPFVAAKLRGLWSAGACVLWSGILGGAVFLGLLAAAGRLLTRAGYI